MNKREKTKNIQKLYKIKQDGLLGPHTVDCMYRGNSVVTYPYFERFYGCDVIVGDCDNFAVFSPYGEKSVKDYDYTMSATFTHPPGVMPISIMVNDGEVIYPHSCRYWAGFPETVLYYTYDGEYGTMLAKHADELPKNAKWAIGGGNLVNFAFNEEGFKFFVHEGKSYDHSDVKRRTAHVGYIIDALGNILGIYHPNCTLSEFQKKALSMGAQYGIFVDGGHIPAYNTPKKSRNKYTKQGSMTQFKEVTK